jgi:hypothetical protein
MGVWELYVVIAMDRQRTGFSHFVKNGVINQSVSARWTYRNLCQLMVESFTTGTPAVPHSFYLEETRFVLAALESERQQGTPVSLQSIT